MNKCNSQVNESEVTVQMYSLVYSNLNASMIYM